MMADLTRHNPALASAARTASTDSALFVNQNRRGCQVLIDMTAITATGDVTFKVQGYDELSGTYYDLITSASVTTVSEVMLKIYPGLTAAANLTVSDNLPYLYRITTTHLNGVSMTYSVGVNLLI